MRALLALLVATVAGASRPALAEGDEERLVFRRVLTPVERAWYARTLQAVIDAIGERCEPILPERPERSVPVEQLVPATAELLPEGAFPRAGLLLRCESERVTIFPFASEMPKLPISARVVQRGPNAFLFRVFERASLVVSAGPSDARPRGDLAPIRSVVLTWGTPWAADGLRLARQARWGAMSYALRARLAGAPPAPPSCARGAEPEAAPERATIAEETAVVEALLRHHVRRAPAGQLLNIEAEPHTLGVVAREAALRAPCLFPATYEAFAARTAASGAWPAGPSAAGFDVHTRVELLEAHRAGGGRIETVFPDTDGWVSFSRVAFDPAVTQALVSISWIRGAAGSGATYVLERREGEWVVLYVGGRWDAVTPSDARVVDRLP
jgi:hypothetical protein